MNKEEAKDELIKVLESQVMDLSMMSKIELGDDVIAEIKRLKGLLNLKNKIMENKSKQIERIATKIQESLQLWETIGGDLETKQECEIKQFPKMYHPTEELIKIPIYTDGTKVIITIEKVKPYTIENTEDKIYTNSENELKEIDSDTDGIEKLFVEMSAQQVHDKYIKPLISNPDYKLPETGAMLFYAKKHPEGYNIDKITLTSLNEDYCISLIESVMDSEDFAGWPFSNKS
jgi:hypothetical protein